MLMWTFSPIGSLAAFAVVLLASVGFTRREDRPEPDAEQRIADLTLKVRHPLRYRVQAVSRWMR
jgi:hypothetical protein